MTVTFALIAKEPASGRAKTRLVPRLGRSGAAAVAAALLLDAAEALDAAAPRGARLVLAHDPPDAAPRLRGLGLPQRFACVPQAGGGLGDRLAALMLAELGAGASACVIAATDSPFAVHGIARCVPTAADEVVLAPCEDGGYWAVGLARPAPIFAIPMSTPDVLEATVAAARRAGRPVRLLEPALDIDDGDDLARAAALGLLRRAPRLASAVAAAGA